MKFFVAFLIVLFFISCKNAAEDSVQVKAVQKNDSEIIKRELANPYVQKDISQMDMSYLPADYPIQKMSKTATNMPVARVIYSRPHKQGRKVFGTLLKYGEPWRLGANEATEIEFFKEVIIQKKKVAKGRYILYCIPQQDKWTIIFNTNIYSWGLKPNPQKDEYKFEIPVQRTTHSIEYFTMLFQTKEAGTGLLIAWDDVEARLPIQF